ncbi:TrbG/VirB9 family P-type conjugative transfer protein [Rickettsiales endosymbiont of Trichoplax sp. H2]|uniref:TrbG/VirB9 family P-type conjugative transfer protein n=1 Tax=Rickettsiales endosymbiont of Trichoplax sp. H2 TaxID=2021221 RepID=UPI0012B3D4D4|nr:TrbG/VirB9 family P-type conjugative transfer protein [Rickettsiales endosymbiont of Trichoplax sp. H2]MSO14126.1 Type IV secretion system protein virB9 [Rickettsiales endosymbiont of Trichoplax sp. H2]
MKIAKKICLISFWYLFAISFIFASDNPISTDSRIKTLIYNPNEIFRLVVHFNFQTSVEFEKDEEIKTITTGNSYAWQLIPIDNRLFIKPLEDNILTNMTIITNKRVYQFEVQSKPYSGYVDNELVYVARFYFPSPDEKIDYPEIKKNDDKQDILEVKPYNFNYEMVGPVKYLPSKVFDDGLKTYIYYDKDITFKQPFIKVIKNNKVLKIKPNIVGDYLVIDNIGKHLELSFNNNVIEITNKNYIN